MSGQIAQWGAAAMINKITRQALPVVSATPPTSWVPGQEWINSSSGYAVYTFQYPGTAVYSGTTAYIIGNQVIYDGYLYSCTAATTGNAPSGTTASNSWWSAGTLAWAAVGSLYLALLTADPTTSGANGSPAVNISDLVEDQTAGYARQAITFTQVTEATAAAPPEPASNTTAITFGPYTANQALAVQWGALVTVASGSAGTLLYTWNLDTIEQVQVSQPIIIPAGDLLLEQQ